MPEYPHGITGVSSKYQLSITQILDIVNSPGLLVESITGILLTVSELKFSRLYFPPEAEIAQVLEGELRVYCEESKVAAEWVRKLAAPLRSQQY